MYLPAVQFCNLKDTGPPDAQAHTHTQMATGWVFDFSVNTPSKQTPFKDAASSKRF